MKKYNIIYAILCAGLIATSCDSFLDTMPDNRADVDSKETITALLVSAYPISTDRLMTEMSSDNAMDNGKKFSVEDQAHEDSYLWNDITSIRNDSPQAYWQTCYKAIAAANLALESIADLGNPESLNAQKGEALMCRAYGHFALANTFCLAYNPLTADADMGIPYSNASETELNPQGYERGNMADLYAKINADIEEGLPLINDVIYSVPKYHFNVKAAHAFAARFNLYYLKYDKVIEYANVVLGSNPSNMMRDWRSINLAPGFSARSDMYISASEPANLLLGTAKSSWAYWVGPYSLGERYGHSREIIEKETVWADAIWAYENFFPSNSAHGFDEKVVIPKMNGYFEYTDKVAGIGFRQIVPVLFSSNETILCRAEAYALKNDFASATSDINIWLGEITKNNTQTTMQEIVDFYSAMEYMPIDNSVRTSKKEINPLGFIVADGDQENMIQCILHLRRVETIHEGLRWNDIKRYGIVISHNRDGLENDVLELNDPRRAIQLPQDVIRAGLAANPRN